MGLVGVIYVSTADDVSDAVAHPGYAPFFEHGLDPARLGAKPGIALELLQEFARSNT
jgi:hypothetical protein